MGASRTCARILVIFMEGTLFARVRSRNSLWRSDRGADHGLSGRAEPVFSAAMDEIETIISQRAHEWGLGSVDIRLTDATMDESLLRAMMRETEARKEASALQIKAESDKAAAQMFTDAAKTLASSQGAMTLRVLQSWVVTGILNIR